MKNMKERIIKQLQEGTLNLEESNLKDGILTFYDFDINIELYKDGAIPKPSTCNKYEIRINEIEGLHERYKNF